MSDHYFDIAFTPSVRDAQAQNGSAEAYGRLIAGTDKPDPLTEREISFIQQRDSFYMATVSETGWPYLQHRGGPVGFVKVLAPDTIGIADYRGNRQYLSLGNLRKDDRTALFFMDYPRQQRLKVFAHARDMSLENDPELIGQLTDESYGAKIERGMIFRIEAFDWNCPQHITPRFTEAEIADLS
ncbi:MAG: pyridoxamine 5'-phosphate oxidase family protein [Pseudomonadota bacterium]